ncbi:MAG: hypothetical protein VX589_14915 [Myxococcota bacterium]|nr:hypothetical protein [Myxococcota bacterium]
MTHQEPEDEWLYADDVELSLRPTRRGVMMRHPFLLCLVIGAATFLGYKTWPKAAFFFAELADCGPLLERAQDLSKAEGQFVPLRHDTYCTLAGTVQTLNTFATPKKDGTQPGRGGQIDTLVELEGVKYYVKLAGGHVFAILPADRKDVHAYRVKKQRMFGFSIDEPGRVIDPTKTSQYARTGRFLKLKFALSDEYPIYLFNVADHPVDRWPYLLIMVLMGATALLALFGLGRIAWFRWRV